MSGFEFVRFARGLGVPSIVPRLSNGSILHSLCRISCLMHKDDKFPVDARSPSRLCLCGRCRGRLDNGLQTQGDRLQGFQYWERSGAEIHVIDLVHLAEEAYSKAVAIDVTAPSFGEVVSYYRRYRGACKELGGAPELIAGLVAMKVSSEVRGVSR